MERQHRSCFKPKHTIFIVMLLVGVLVIRPNAGQAQLVQMVETMTQQIAALEAYLKVAEKGYQIAENGLHAIHDIKNGEFNLHSTFFASLQAVNPKIASMAEVVEIATLQTGAIRQFQQAISRYKSAGILNGAESSYLSTVYQNLVKIIGDDVTALSNLVTSSDVSMTDGERIRRIQVLDERAKDQARYVQSVTAQTDLLVTERSRGNGDISTLQSIYGLK
ncbi:MAG: hypothetical protein P4L51_23460 [Puia sp.]|nr:hypothetical protein [Puia sp.]